eukprot:14488233-Alexandrium_andersonii.AAC.1
MASPKPHMSIMLTCLSPLATGSVHRAQVGTSKRDRRGRRRTGSAGAGAGEDKGKMEWGLGRVRMCEMGRRAHAGS